MMVITQIVVHLSATAETCYLVDKFLLSSGTLDYAGFPKEISGIAVIVISSSTCGLPREWAYVPLCWLLSAKLPDIDNILPSDSC